MHRPGKRLEWSTTTSSSSSGKQSGGGPDYHHNHHAKLRPLARAVAQPCQKTKVCVRGSTWTHSRPPAPPLTQPCPSLPGPGPTHNTVHKQIACPRTEAPRVSTLQRATQEYVRPSAAPSRATTTSSWPWRSQRRTVTSLLLRHASASPPPSSIKALAVSGAKGGRQGGRVRVLVLASCTGCLVPCAGLTADSNPITCNFELQPDSQPPLSIYLSHTRTHTQAAKNQSRAFPTRVCLWTTTTGKALRHTHTTPAPLTSSTLGEKTPK